MTTVTDTGARGDPSGGSALYRELAAWWPLVSPAEDYAAEAAYLAGLLRAAERPVREVLELGSGGGHLASHLAGSFELTLTDLSPAMLDLSRRLNPGCTHRVGDMRDLRLGRTVDAVLVHDAVDYVTDRDDLRRVAATAFAHCRPGGVAVLVPDDVAETFAPRTEHGGVDGDDGRGARYLEWCWDPDPRDTWVRTEYALLLRERDGTTRVRHETHRHGLFPRRVWLDVLTGAGFRAGMVREQTTEQRPPRDVFVAHRPEAGPLSRAAPG